MHRHNFFRSCQAVALRRLVLFSFLLILVRLSMFAASPIQERADRFLALANAGYQAVYRVNSEAQWTAVTDVTPEHDAAAEATGKAYAAFNGNPAIINEARELLTHQKELSEITVRQLKQLLLNAAEGPMTNPELVAKRVAAETKQASLLNSFEFKLNGQKITANEIDNKLEKSTDLDRAQSSLGSVEGNRARVKTKSRDTARPAQRRRERDEVSRLFCAPGRRLRHDHRRDAQDARRLDGDTASALFAAAYLGEIQARREISSAGAEKNSGPLDQQSLGQEWPGLVEAANIDKYFEGRKPEWIIKTAEQFYTGLGFSPLPESFWKKSICIRCRRIEAEEKYARLVLAYRSRERHSFACKASSRTRGGFSPRIMSSVTAITSRPTRGRKFRTCCDSAQRPDSTKASAN